MARRIDRLPRRLQPIANQIDQASGVGNADGRIDLAEVDQARAAKAADPGALPGLDESALREIEKVFGRTPASGGDPRPATGGTVASVGPGGIYQSTLDAAKDGLQREVIRFDTGAGGGIKLDGRIPFEVPRQLRGDGVVGVKIEVSGTFRTLPRATVGDRSVGAIDPASAGATQPLHGPLLLTADGPATVRSIEILYQKPTPLEVTDFYPIGRSIKAGESVDIELPAHRHDQGMDQIEAIWTASYSVPDPSGRKSDEGKPFYLDGVYCDLFLVDGSGRERRIDRTKFVDANETDNSHDLGGPTGQKLHFKFFARDDHGKNHAISFGGVRVRYQAPATATPPQYFDVNKVFEPGQAAEVVLPPSVRDKKIGMVEVRWTDMLSGTWTRPGYAKGTLEVDGKQVGTRESVQSPETQTFSYLGGVKAKGGKVGVRIDSDKARIDWIRVHFED